MPKATKARHYRLRSTISLISSIIVGLILLTAGSGKIFGFGEMPAQTMKFLTDVLPDAWLTPWVTYFLGEIFLRYIIPWSELILGLLLLVRIWPRFCAVITLPLIASFMANNIYYIMQGKALEKCGCWGIWAIILGDPTHLQSFYIDIGLFVLALIAVFVDPARLFALPSWLAKPKKLAVQGKK